MSYFCTIAASLVALASAEWSLPYSGFCRSAGGYPKILLQQAPSDLATCTGTCGVNLACTGKCACEKSCQANVLCSGYAFATTVTGDSSIDGGNCISYGGAPYTSGSGEADVVCFAKTGSGVQRLDFSGSSASDSGNSLKSFSPHDSSSGSAQPQLSGSSGSQESGSSGSYPYIWQWLLIICCCFVVCAGGGGAAYSSRKSGGKRDARKKGISASENAYQPVNQQQQGDMEGKIPMLPPITVLDPSFAALGVNPMSFNTGYPAGNPQPASYVPMTASQPAAVSYQQPATEMFAQPTNFAAPAAYAAAPAVSYTAAPAVSYTAAPAVSYAPAPAVSYTGAGSYTVPAANSYAPMATGYAPATASYPMVSQVSPQYY